MRGHMWFNKVASVLGPLMATSTVPPGAGSSFSLPIPECEGSKGKIPSTEGHYHGYFDCVNKYLEV